MSSSRDNISLYNNEQYNILSYSEYNQAEDKDRYSYSIVNADNTTKGFSEELDAINEKQQLTQIQNNFKWLKLQLLENQRPITWLDYYKIAGSFGDETEGAVSFNDMLKNSALIARNTVDYHGEAFLTGDLLYKQNNGQPLKLELGLSGIYVPLLEEKENNYILKWKWFEKGVTVPNEDGVKDGEIQEEQAYGSYTYQLTKDSTVKYYGKAEIIESATLTIEAIPNLTPIIKWFHKEGEIFEEVYWDFILKKITNEETGEIIKYTINNIPSYINYAVVK